MRNWTGVIVTSLLVIVIGAGFLYHYHMMARAHGITNSSSHSRDSADTAPDVSNSSKWVLAFSDDFNGNTLNTDKWSTCYDWREPATDGCTNTGNNEQEWYLPSQVSVHGGAAVLTATNDPVTVDTPQGVKTYPYRSGMISTGRTDTDSPVKWSATYGYYVASIKFDGGHGVWPAFWLLPANRNWPPEIDIMESLGKNPNQVLLTNHWPSPDGPQQNSTVVTGADYTSGWHTYAINWQPGVIDWYVDGLLKKTVTGPTVPDTPMEMIFDLAIGGKLPGYADSTTPFPRTMEIDNVKVYEKRM
jgi:beta-glucanase (GH16 family)